MNKFIPLTFLLLAQLCSANNANAGSINGLSTEKKQKKLTPEQALDLLKEGNARYVAGQLRRYDFPTMRKIAAKKGQFPFGVILSCIDSRSVPELTFDQPIGNLFTIRVAGNLINPDILASMEYATEFVGSKLIVVMGHTQCGAMDAACDEKVYPSHLKTLLDQIQPAVNAVKASHKDFSCDSVDTIDAIAKQNVLDQLQAIYQQSPILRKLIDDHKILLVGAMQDLKTGRVTFIGEK